MCTGADHVDFSAGLRALAAWTVVCHHFMQIFFDFKARGPVGQFFIDKGAVGVDVFFVISGLVIFLSTESKHCRRRGFCCTGCFALSRRTGCTRC
jgi:peptidoglycan/LPS O-acetylase OafA/YrhL